MNKIVYTEENDLRIYESMPAADFKEFFMAYFKYRKGDKVAVNDFSSPMTFALFTSYIPKLDNMENNYNKRVANGKKGGRPRKEETNDITASNTSNDEIHQPVVDNGSESLKIANNDTREIPAEFAIEEPVKENKPDMENYTDILPNGVVIPRNLFLAVDNYIRLDKKDRVNGLSEYEETEKEEYIESINKQLKASGYSTEDIDDIAFAVVCRREEELAA